MNHSQPFRGRGSLAQVVTELKRQQVVREDVVMNVRDIAIAVDPDLGPIVISATNSGRDYIPKDGLPLLDQALVQFAERAPVPPPIRFLRSAMQKYPLQTADWINSTMHEAGGNRLIRILDGKVRAFLSDRYRAIESLDVVAAALSGADELANADGVFVLEASVSDSHVRIKIVNTAVRDRLDAEGGRHSFVTPGSTANSRFLGRVGFNASSVGVVPGDVLWPIVTIANSDTGHGGFTADVGLIEAICTNLAVIAQSVRQIHLGERLDTGIYTTETIQAEARAITLKGRDTIAVAFNEDSFRSLVNGVRSQASRIALPPTKAADAIIRIGNGFNAVDMDALLARFAGSNGSIYGIGSAVARLAQDTDDPEIADSRERLAGEIMTGKLNSSLWLKE